MDISALALAGPLTVDTPLAPGRLLLRAMHGTEAISRPFVFDLELISKDDAVKGDDLLGQPVAVHIEHGNRQVRHFHGIVTRFRWGGVHDDYVVYHATLRPWFWLLSRRTNCRIFQDKTIPEIVKEVLRDHGQSDFVESLTGDYQRQEYVVQYLESDFHFVNRLLERVGIYYYFRHEAAKHKLVLADGRSSHDRAPDCPELPYYPPDPHRARLEPHIDRWEAGDALDAGKFATSDYNFKQPAAYMLATAAAPKPHAFADFEVYDYPGGYMELGDREPRARLRLEQIQALQHRTAGSSNAPGLVVGNLLGLTGHPRPEENREYLVLGASYDLRGHERTSGEEASEVFHCSFEAVPSSVQLRPPRATRRPVMRGPQTAIVTGAQADEIHTDEFGRVKVKFFWDRWSEADEHSSCWIRVAQAWAGGGWGSIHIPRVGQEVIVDFLEGDPDRPIITGRVYNGLNPVPYELPAKATQSGIKSRSSKDGSSDNFNEIRFEDAKGQEELFVQAERNHTIKVKKDQSTSVGASRSVSVGGDEAKTVSGSRTVHVKGNQSTTVDGGGKGAYQSSYSVTGKHKLHASDLIDVDAPTHIKLECGGSSVLIEPGKITLQAGGGAKLVLDANAFAEAAGKGSILVDANVLSKSTNAGKLLVDATVVATSAAGSEMKLDANASLSTGAQAAVSAPTVIVAGTQAVKASAGSGSLELGAAGATLSGAKTSVSAKGVLEVAGGLVKIN